jgi:UDP-glucuronate 4-epimerase
MKILVTGAAGFIGYFTSARLLARGDEVVGLDNLNEYYDADLKRARLDRLQQQRNFRFFLMDLADRAEMARLFSAERFDRVVHLGAQAGVRYALYEPHSYIESNVMGTLNVLEGCRNSGVGHLVYASTSSVYGANEQMPFSEHHPASHPLSLYAATKRSTELMAHSYSSLFQLPTTGLRLFTVYGPWGRPDMALFLFARAIMEERPIELFNHGRHTRDFTYVEDVCEAIVRVVDRVPQPDPAWNARAPDPATGRVPYRLYNVGSSRPVALARYVELLEQYLGRKAERVLLPMQPGDVPDTFADVTDLATALDYRPTTPVETGVRNFVDWFKSYYGYNPTAGGRS